MSCDRRVRAAASALVLVSLVGFAASRAAASTSHYFYDPLGRLIGETTTGSPVRANYFDAADNRTNYESFQTAQFSGGQRLTSSETLLQGQVMASSDGVYNLGMQEDGNLVLYHGATALWSTGTASTNTAALFLGSDGNLVLQDAQWRTVWSTNTSGNPGAFLQVQTDGNLVLYTSDGRALWASNTSGQ